MTKTIAILHGIFEGPGISRRLERALQKAGYKVVPDAAQADVIFAHSGGCYLIPPANRAKLVVLVGLAYWPGRLWVLATIRKVWREGRIYGKQNRMREWGQKWFYHACYAFKLRTYLRMALNRNIRNPWNSMQPQIIIRNCNDVYCQPDITMLPFRGPRTFISLPGEHDDCWDHPERYVNLLQSLTH